MINDQYDISGFAQRLAEARQKAGYKSKTEFAKLLGLEPATYRKYERDTDKKAGVSMMSYGMLLKVSIELKVSIDYLIKGGGESNNSPPAPQCTSGKDPILRHFVRYLHGKETYQNAMTWILNNYPNEYKEHAPQWLN